MTKDKTDSEAPQTVEVNKEKLDELIKRSDDQSKLIEMLLATADKSRIARYQELQGKPITPVVRLRTFRGEIVVGWRSTADEIFQDGNGIWHERQTVEIVTEAGTKAELPYLESEKLPKIEADVVGTSTRFVDGQEQVIMMVKTKDGKELNIDRTYVN